MQSRRREPAYAGAPGYGGNASPRSWDMPAGGTAVQERAPAVDELDRGLGHVRQMDPGFDAAGLASDAAETFRAVQMALAAGDLRPLHPRLSADMREHLEAQVEALRRAGHRSHVERIQIERTEVTEAWQERGQDFVTVLLAGSLIDYTVDAGRCGGGGLAHRAGAVRGLLDVHATRRPERLDADGDPDGLSGLAEAPCRAG